MSQGTEHGLEFGHVSLQGKGVGRRGGEGRDKISTSQPRFRVCREKNKIACTELVEHTNIPGATAIVGVVTLYGAQRSNSVLAARLPLRASRTDYRWKV
jgi:hypothetical protein